MWLHQALTDILQVLSCGTFNQKVPKLALEIALSKSESKKSAEDAAAEEQSKCLAAEVSWEGGKSDEEASAGYVV